MRVLFLAPHPFFQERGTPIAVNLLLDALSRMGHTIDVVTYHEGVDVRHRGVTLHRIARMPFVNRIHPGFSWKKMVCDALMLPVILRLVCTRKYDLVHAVEESAFMAWLLKLLLRLPYVYDMDSSLAEQMVEKKAWLAPGLPILRWFESAAVRGAAAVVPVCDALADTARRYRPRKLFVLHDVSLLKADHQTGAVDLRQSLNVTGPMLMYVGNLETYQGIDLLLDSFAAAQVPTAVLVIVGGAAADIIRYEQRCRDLRIADNVRFIGPRPISDLAHLLAEADILTSPRTKGRNTPMKIYSYLAAGKAILATSILSHTQVLNDEVALLAPPEVGPFSQAIVRLCGDDAHRERLGSAARRLAERKYSLEAFREGVGRLYHWLESSVLRTKPEMPHENPGDRRNGVYGESSDPSSARERPSGCRTG